MHRPELLRRYVRDSDPYFHDGSVADLAGAVERERVASGSDYDGEDDRLITVFLREGLVDATREPERPDSVPSGLPVPEDGFRIPR